MIDIVHKIESQKIYIIGTICAVKGSIRYPEKIIVQQEKTSGRTTGVITDTDVNLFLWIKK